MDKMIAYCGINCHTCPAYIATQKDDGDERRKVAETWSTLEHQLSPEQINCDGCFGETKRLFFHCQNCKIRECAMQNRLPNCGHCKNYPCKNLTNFIAHLPKAKQNLDKIYKKLNQ